jgi:hypothetical protein
MFIYHCLDSLVWIGANYTTVTLLPYNERFEACDYVKQLFVDVALAHLVEAPLQMLQKVHDILVGAVHGSQPACVVAGKGFRTGAEQRDERYSRTSARRASVSPPIT